MLTNDFIIFYLAVRPWNLLGLFERAGNWRKKYIFYCLPIVISLKYKWPSSLKWHLFPTYVPCLLFLHLCSSEWEFALKHSLRCWREQQYFFYFFFFHFTWILSLSCHGGWQAETRKSFPYNSRIYVSINLILIPQCSGHYLFPSVVVMIIMSPRRKCLLIFCLVLGPTFCCKFTKLSINWISWVFSTSFCHSRLPNQLGILNIKPTHTKIL